MWEQFLWTFGNILGTNLIKKFSDVLVPKCSFPKCPYTGKSFEMHFLLPPYFVTAGRMIEIRSWIRVPLCLTVVILFDAWVTKTSYHFWGSDYFFTFVKKCIFSFFLLARCRFTAYRILWVIIANLKSAAVLFVMSPMKRIKLVVCLRMCVPFIFKHQWCDSKCRSKNKKLQKP